MPSACGLHHVEPLMSEPVPLSSVGIGPGSQPVTASPSAGHVPLVIPPPATVPLVIPPVLQASISSLSPTHAAVGAKITIHCSGFGTPGSVKLAPSPEKSRPGPGRPSSSPCRQHPGSRPWLYSDVTGPLWYLHAPTILVTETPRGAVASNAVRFRLDSHNQQGWHENKQVGRHHGRHAGERN